MYPKQWFPRQQPTSCGNPLAVHVYAVNMFEEMPVKDTVVDSLVFLCVLLLIHL